MPKEVLDLRNFSGGLNNNTNPRDLDTSEFQELKGLSLETPGKLKISGSVTDLPHASSADEEKFTTTLNYGNGLFHFNSDRDPNNGALSNTELLLINDVTNHKVKVFDKTDGAYESGSEIDYGTASSEVNYYAVNGNVRVSPHSYTVASTPQNQPKWYGYLKYTKNYGDADANAHILKSVDGFKVANSFIAPIKSSTSTGSGGPDGYGNPHETLVPIGNLPSHQSEFLFNPNIASYTINDGSITPDGTVAERLGNFVTGLSGSYSDWSSGYGPMALYMWCNPDTTSSDDTEGITVYDIVDGKKYSIWVSLIYDNQESNIYHVGDISQPSIAAVTGDKKRKLYYALTGRFPNNDRLTGYKIYWALEDDGSVGTKYLFMEIDIRKGYRLAGKDGFKALSASGSFIVKQNDGSNAANAQQFYTQASFVAGGDATQRVLGHLQDGLPTTEPFGESKGVNPIGRPGTSYKTSTILNRRAYVGNVTYYDEDNNLITADDTVLKSEVNKFDTFDFNKRLDVEINDGDAIIRLESIGNKLLQFKKNNLFIVNCSRDQELLEATLKYKGCEKEYHVVKAEGFVAWFNKYGVFLYDGEQLRDLLIGPTGQKRFKDWNTQYFSNDGVIGYIPDKQTLIIANPAIGGLNNNPSGGVLEIDLKTLGWAYSALKLNTVDVSNFVNVNDGKLVWFEKDSNDIELKYWNPEPSLRDSSNASVVLKTPAFDFGDPSRDKTITTVYINYKNGEDITVKGFTDVAASNDGSAFSSVTLGTLAGNNDTTNRVAKFKVRGITSAFKKVKTFGLELTGATDQQDFEINDMQIVHRVKTIK